MQKLYFWIIDRNPRFIRILDPPMDDTGRTISEVFNPRVPDGSRVSFFAEKRAFVPDFIYDIGSSLLVSRRVLDIIKQFRMTDVRILPADLRLAFPGGDLLSEIFWLLPQENVYLLDEASSRIEGSSYSCPSDIFWFAQNASAEPKNDLFVCEETGARAFTAPLVQAIQNEGATGARFILVHGSQWPFRT